MCVSVYLFFLFHVVVAFKLGTRVTPDDPEKPQSTAARAADKELAAAKLQQRKAFHFCLGLLFPWSMCEIACV